VDLGPLRPFETTWEDWVLGGGAAASFPDPTRPLEVEIGPGEDDFLLESAIARPDRNWLGIEYSRKRVRRYVRRLEALPSPLPNLRLIWRPAEDLVEEFLAPARVEAYHLLFPDPWPKKHHARFRLLQPPFVDALAASLVPGGTIVICTDVPAYVEQVLEALATAPALENLLGPPGFESPGPGPRESVFERRWREMGRSILRLRWRRIPAATRAALERP
jgi:tRNA (guanine-N7-)-methyltransferase